MGKRLYLVDGNSCIYRAFYAIRGLTNDDGLPTNAVYGFTGQLLRLLREERPDLMAVVFDKSERSFRNDLYAPYKAHRPPMPEDLVEQLPYTRQVARALGLEVLEVGGYEADDVIGTLATLAAATPDVETVIVSSDKDLMQLVDARCTLLDTMRDVRYGPAEVAEKTGVRPDQIVDWLALMGDSSDNIPGVKGIGKKGAAALLEQYGDLDGLYARLEEQRGKRREHLERDRDQAYLSRTLATLACDVPLDVTLEGLRPGQPDRRRLTALFAELGFRGWHREFYEAEGEPGAGAEPEQEQPRVGGGELHLVRDEAGLRGLVAAVAAAAEVGVTALTGDAADRRRGALVGIALATSAEEAWYLPLGHDGVTAGPQVTASVALDALRPLLADPARAKVVHDAKLERQVFAHHGVPLRGVVFDTMLASYLADAGKPQHTLHQIALDRLGIDTTEREDLVGRGRGRLRFAALPPEAVRDHACDAARLPLAARDALAAELRSRGLDSLLRDLELPLAGVLADMERVGVCVDVPRLEALSTELGQRAGLLEGRALLLAGEDFNLGSPKQLGTILFDKLGLKGSKKTKSGWSTDASVLEELARAHDLPAVVLEWRRLTKLRGTYADALPALVRPESGRIHTSFHQAVAATGRLSSSDPNLQNIPIRTADGRRIREAFVAGAAGHVLLSADYSQIELRLVAHLSGDPAFLQAFREGADIHRRTAAELFEVAEEAVTREQRGMAKTINFGIMYGMSAFRLAREQSVSRSEAKAIIDAYFARYPRVLRWKKETLAEARQSGQVATLLGRVRAVPGVRARNGAARAAAERVAVNTPVQGSAADIIKLAMVRIAPRLQRELPDARMVLQVHDELVFEVPEAEAEALARLVAVEMESVVDLDVPLVVNTAWGSTWLEAH